MVNKLPEKELLRVDEVAAYFDVTDRTVRLWLEHGFFEAKKIGGVIRIYRESVLTCGRDIGVKLS